MSLDVSEDDLIKLAKEGLLIMAVKVNTGELYFSRAENNVFEGDPDYKIIPADKISIKK